MGTVLVTGGCGYIGSHVVWELMDAGERVIVLDDLSTGSANVIPKAVPLIKADCGDYAKVNEIIVRHQVEVVIHLAAKCDVEESMRQPLRYYHENVEKMRQLLTAATNGGCYKFVFSSSAAVYGNPERSRLGAHVHEDTPPVPVNPYGRTKLIGEWMLRDEGVKHVTLRYFNVAGADSRGRTGQVNDASTLIKAACRVAVGKEPKLKVFGTDYPTADGTAVRDFVHVTDIARAHVNALLYLRHRPFDMLESCTLNVGYGRGYSVMEVVREVEKISKKALPIELCPRRPGDIVVSIAGAEAIRKALGWRPQFNDLAKIVSSALAWERRSAQAG